MSIENSKENLTDKPRPEYQRQFGIPDGNQISENYKQTNLYIKPTHQPTYQRQNGLPNGSLTTKHRLPLDVNVVKSSAKRRRLDI